MPTFSSQLKPRCLSLVKSNVCYKSVFCVPAFFNPPSAPNTFQYPLCVNLIIHSITKNFILPFKLNWLDVATIFYRSIDMLCISRLIIPSMYKLHDLLTIVNVTTIFYWQFVVSGKFRPLSISFKYRHIILIAIRLYGTA